MGTFTKNTVSSGSIIYASDHNTLGDLIAAVLNGSVDSTNLADNAVTTAKIADSALTRPKVDWSTFSNNIKSALNTSAPTLSNTSQDLASCGLTLSFTSSGTSYALVTVSLGIGSTTDFEFQPEIRLGGSVQKTLTPNAALTSAGGRASVMSFSYKITLADGSNTISAGVNLSSSTTATLPIGGGCISAIVFGNITA